MVDEQSPALTHTRKLSLLGHYIDEGQKLLQPKPPVNPLARAFPKAPVDDSFQRIARWKDDLRQTLDLIEASEWKPVVDAIGESRSEIVIGLNSLRALRLRLKRREPLGLSEDHRDLLALRSRLFIWGDQIADRTDGGPTQTTYGHSEYTSFLSALPKYLADAHAYLEATRFAGMLPITTDLVRDRLDEDSLTDQVNADAWHAGWALMTLAWWIADAIGDPLTLNFKYMGCTFEQARASAFQLIDGERVPCPGGCGRYVEVEGQNERWATLVNNQWACEPCALAGYFPATPAPRSVWTQRPETALKEKDEETADEPELDLEVSTPDLDLSWMLDADLRQIAEDDFEEMKTCLRVRACKATLLLAGSLCESMLLDVLERNTSITKTYFDKRPDDFPDRASLEYLVDIATEEKLLTDTALDLAPAIRKYRDLVHPNRVRQRKIKVDIHTAELLPRMAGIIARDLRDATSDGRVAAFEKK